MDAIRRALASTPPEPPSVAQADAEQTDEEEL